MRKVPHHRTMKSLTSKIYDRVKMNPPTDEIKLHVPTLEKSDPSVIVTPIDEDNGQET